MGYCVYKHTNKINGKVYIGQTGMKLEERWGSDGRRYKSSTHFRYAIEKYGWDNFEHEVIKDSLTKEEADYWEKYYISFYNSMNPEFGYNMSPGGSNGGHPQTEETRKKISKNGYHMGMLGKKLSEEHKRRIRESQIGRVVSDKSKEKMRKSALKNRGRLFLCVELNRVFDNLNEAHEVTTCPKGSIVQCCQGKQIQSKGYHWEYAD